MSKTYSPADPLSLQTGQTIKVRPVRGEPENFLCARARMVDGMNRFVTVQFDGTDGSVALLFDDWIFETLDVDPTPLPDIDGMYVAKDEIEAVAPTRIFRLQAGEWTDILNPAAGVLDPEEIPPLVPLRAATKPSATPTGTIPVQTPASPEENPA